MLHASCVLLLALFSVARFARVTLAFIVAAPYIVYCFCCFVSRGDGHAMVCADKFLSELSGQ